MISKRIGGWLRMEACRRELSLREIAVSSGVGATTVRKIARGEGVQMECLAAVVETLGWEIRPS